MAKKQNGLVLPDETVMNKILLIREQKVMIDRDLAELYGTTTVKLNQQVKRNKKRFPPDFMFQLTEKEKNEVITNCDNLKSLKFSPHLPLAFTEHGAVMLASVLNSDRAIAVNIQIVRVFTKIRSMLLTHKDILLKLEQVERKILKQDEKSEKFEKEIQIIFKALKQLLNSPQPERERIGYKKS
ncbi:MAG: ORF6N domain-containing protein [Bacteroidia bacterium]|nr:ORF6N domain-containing protein [Bacteroidia bacterium]